MNLRRKSSTKTGLYALIVVLVLAVSGILLWGVNGFGRTPVNADFKKAVRTIPPTVAVGDGPPLPAPNSINVQNYGAKGDGKSNDTEAIQAAINAAGKGKIVYFPPGDYQIDAVRSLHLKSDTTLQLSADTILRAIPNAAPRYAILTVTSVENVQITGGVLIGDRHKHFGLSGEWGMGIRIVGAKNVEIQGTTCNDFWGDGIYIGETTGGIPSENIRIIDFRADGNRRQGISLISGRNIEIAGSRITNTQGTAPAAGIDIEPNQPRNVLENIRIRDLYTAGNQGAGVLINPGAISGTRIPINIAIVNHQDENSDRGMQISSKGIIPGRVAIENPQWRNARRNAIAIQSHDYRSFQINIQRAMITDANQASQGAAIDIYRLKNTQPMENGGIGNVRIDSPVIADTRDPTRTMAAFSIWDIPGLEIRNLVIINPVLRGNLSKLLLQNDVRTFVHYSQP